MADILKYYDEMFYSIYPASITIEKDDTHAYSGNIYGELMPCTAHIVEIRLAYDASKEYYIMRRMIEEDRELVIRIANNIIVLHNPCIYEIKEDTVCRTIVLIVYNYNTYECNMDWKNHTEIFVNG